ncbi:hypothetical protein L208DRAFT_499839 [Tricholoma matsutake]|nr:hypothetical protein L208DRAFT_499839 [Tricholoma matsutake 945]
MMIIFLVDQCSKTRPTIHLINVYHNSISIASPVQCPEHVLIELSCFVASRLVFLSVLQSRFPLLASPTAQPRTVYIKNPTYYLHYPRFQNINEHRHRVSASHPSHKQPTDPAPVSSLHPAGQVHFLANHPFTFFLARAEIKSDELFTLP